MAAEHAVRSVMLPDGERYCLLVHVPSGVPHYHPNLFVTTQIRNASKSVATMEAALSAIKVLLSFCREANIDLERRILSREFLTVAEIDGLRDACQARLKGVLNASIRTSRRHAVARPRVGLAHEYIRLTYSADYFEWLVGNLLGNRLDESSALRMRAVVKAINARRPMRKGRNAQSKLGSLSKEECEALERVEAEGAAPFTDVGVFMRNRLILRSLRGLGLRAGELLGIRIRDIDWQSNQLVVMRRHDQRDDPRTRQPRAKTLDRRIPLGDSLAREMHEYVLKYRRLVPGARKHDYLLVTHKSGPTQGMPFTISALQALFRRIQRLVPELAHLHTHRLRHTWNDQFSEEMDRRDPPLPESEQEQIRSWCMGWKQGSGTGAIYNKRFIQRKAQAIQKKLQDGLKRVPNERAKVSDGKS